MALFPSRSKRLTLSGVLHAFQSQNSLTHFGAASKCLSHFSTRSYPHAIADSRRAHRRTPPIGPLRRNLARYSSLMAQGAFQDEVKRFLNRTAASMKAFPIRSSAYSEG